MSNYSLSKDDVTIRTKHFMVLPQTPKAVGKDDKVYGLYHVTKY